MREWVNFIIVPSFGQFLMRFEKIVGRQWRNAKTEINERRREMSEYKDRFSDASEEQRKKSAFVCESCKTEYSKEDAKKKGQTCCGRSMKELVQEGFGP